MKNTYYEWKHDFKFPAPDNILIPEAWNKYSLFGGRKIPRKLAPMQLFFKEGIILSDSIPSKKLFLFFSEKLVEFITEYYPRRLFQTFPVEVNIDQKGKIIEPYFLINILNKKNVIDKDKSDLDINEYGEINQIKRLYIKEDFFENNDFFRLEGYASLFICSQSFVNRLTETGFTGMKFIPLGETRI